MLKKYEEITDEILKELKEGNNEKVSELLEKRDSLIKEVDMCGGIKDFKRKYKEQGIYKKDEDLLNKMSKLKDKALKDLMNFKDIKDVNIAYTSSFIDDGVSLFIAKV